jgi:hypothetical protein
MQLVWAKDDKNIQEDKMSLSEYYFEENDRQKNFLAIRCLPTLYSYRTRQPKKFTAAICKKGSNNSLH